MAVESRWFVIDHQHKNFVIVIKQQKQMYKNRCRMQKQMYKTSVYRPTLVNGDMQWLTHRKQQKIIKKADIIQQYIDS